MDAFVSRIPKNADRVVSPSCPLPTLTPRPRRQTAVVSDDDDDDDLVVEHARVYPDAKLQPAAEESRKRKRQDSDLLPLAEDVGQEPPPFKPTPFWCRKTDEWARVLWHPRRDGTVHDRSPLYPLQCGKTWFDIASINSDDPGDHPAEVQVDVVDAVRAAAAAKAAEDQAALDLARVRRPQAKRARARPRKPGKAPAGKTLRIRIYPDARQKVVLREWMSTARWTYNKCVAFLRTQSAKPNKKDRLSVTENRLRDLYVVQKGLGLSSVPEGDPSLPKKKGRPKGSTNRAGKNPSSATFGPPARTATGSKRQTNRAARRSQDVETLAPLAAGQAAIHKKEKAVRRQIAKAARRLKRVDGETADAGTRAQDGDGDLSWVASTPYSIRKAAVAEFVIGHRTNVVKGVESAGKHRFVMSFRARKDPTECITVRPEDWARKSGAFASILGPKVMRVARGQSLPETIDYEFKITRDTRYDHYYLCLPMPIDVTTESPPPSGSPSVADGDHTRLPSRPAAGVIALDPGVRTFLAGYTDGGTAVEIGRGSDKRLKRLMVHHDDLRSRIDKGTDGKTIRHRKRHRMEKALSRMRLRARNLIEEVHKKAARWLCENHRYILIPKFETARMTTRRPVAPADQTSTGEAAADNRQADSTTDDTGTPSDMSTPAAITKPRRRGHRRIGRKTARSMYAWAHYRFRERLIHKASQYDWCSVVTVREDYTSKTCGACGRLTNVGSSDVFRCAHSDCGFVGGRDRNAARNILLRFLTEHGPSTSSSSTSTPTTHGILPGEDALETGSPEQGHGGRSFTPAK
nr:HTH OrfB IS605 superfamily domain containing protein [Pandoravirus belohorizontensis]